MRLQKAYHHITHMVVATFTHHRHRHAITAKQGGSISDAPAHKRADGAVVLIKNGVENRLTYCYNLLHNLFFINPSPTGRKKKKSGITVIFCIH